MIIDAFMFWNELELAEIRINELGDLVDKFVIVESREAHGGTVFEPSFKVTPAMEKYKDKINYILMDHLYPEMKTKDDIWLREQNHRQWTLSWALEGTSPKDVIILSDCDEIPRAQAIRNCLPELKENIRALQLDMFYYDVNNFVGEWNGPVAGPAWRFEQHEDYVERDLRSKRNDLRRVYQAGWHFSYFGGVNAIRKKMANFAHSQEDTIKLALYNTKQMMLNDILTGRDIYHRPGEGRKERRSETDPRLPEFFLKNIKQYWHFTESGLAEKLCEI